MCPYTPSVQSVHPLQFRSIFSPSHYVARATHQSFSDYTVLLPRFLINKKVQLLQKISELSAAFLDDRMEEVLARSVTREMEVETVKGRRGEDKRRLVANPGDIIIH